ncbi:hypothetical protein MUN84_01350 [Hymenobacter sp. 5516J-16]|uniref:hypothetical protein n=1 Tax=Hymenobacter sp. 5516J-16 TaxID=2932253 RepID=UPI001FD42F6E|nr:hypothetical protein [Hymenobacter sp. 5516J-16]UOQ77394.1 hypothetical protein MUN84_01350 [Hymenobacter sp. 5516J-16]
MDYSLPIAQLQQLRSELPSLQNDRPADQQQLQHAMQFFIDEIFSLPHGRFLHLDGPALRQQFAHLDTLHQQLEQGHLHLNQPHDWQLIMQQMLLVLDKVLAAEATHQLGKSH